MEKILALIFVLIIALAVLFWVELGKRRNFKPTADKIKQRENLNLFLEPFGFNYEPRGDYFYSTLNCWQRETGYSRLYDESAPLFNMVMDCEPITFSYGGKRWLIEFWKGQYGITTGGEIGIYNTSSRDILPEELTVYEKISDYEMLPMSFLLYKNGKVLIKRSALHWWLTGFKLGEFSEPEDLTMTAKIRFPNEDMAEAFAGGLEKAGYSQGEFYVYGTAVRVTFAKPHTPQPLSSEGLQKEAVQLVNKNNCGIFNSAAKQYSDTMDKLEYLRTFMPRVVDILLKSLHTSEFYTANDRENKNTVGDEQS